MTCFTTLAYDFRKALIPSIVATFILFVVGGTLAFSSLWDQLLFCLALPGVTIAKCVSGKAHGFSRLGALLWALAVDWIIVCFGIVALRKIWGCLKTSHPFSRWGCMKPAQRKQTELEDSEIRLVDVVGIAATSLFASFLSMTLYPPLESFTERWSWEVVTYSAMIGICFLWLKLVRGIRFDQVGMRRGSWSWGKALAVAIGVAGMVFLFMLVSVRPTIREDTAQVTLGTIIRRAVFLCFAEFSGIALGPIAEEVFFRGILFGYLRQKLPHPLGLLIQAVIFTLLHGGSASWQAHLMMGGTLALLYERSRSLYPAILAHGAYNLLVSLFVVPKG